MIKSIDVKFVYIHVHMFTKTQSIDILVPTIVASSLIWVSTCHFPIKTAKCLGEMANFWNSFGNVHEESVSLIVPV